MEVTSRWNGETGPVESRSRGANSGRLVDQRAPSLRWGSRATNSAVSRKNLDASEIKDRMGGKFAVTELRGKKLAAAG